MCSEVWTCDGVLSDLWVETEVTEEVRCTSGLADFEIVIVTEVWTVCVVVVACGCMARLRVVS